MTEAAESKDETAGVIGVASATMIHDLTAALLEEFRSAPALWTALAQDRQEKILDAFKTKCAEAVDKCVAIIIRSAFPAVEAELDSVNRNKNFRARLSIAPDALFRANLVDAVGAKVLVVIADPKRWAERVDELKVKSSQADLFDVDSNKISGIDRAKYRRDEDPLEAAGKTWADLKASLTGTNPDAGETKDGDSDTTAPKGETKPPEGETAGRELTPKEESTALLIELQERLAAMVEVHVSLGFLQAQPIEEIRACVYWLGVRGGTIALVEGEEVPARPSWLPLPSPGI